MTRKPDREYYAARLNAEREAAARAATEAARAAHQTLAEEYAARLDGGRLVAWGIEEIRVGREALRWHCAETPDNAYSHEYLIEGCP